MLLRDNFELPKVDHFGDTTLHLNCAGKGGNNSASLGVNGSGAIDDGCRLVLGLGPTPSTYCNDYLSGTVNKNKGVGTTFSWELPSESDSILQLGLSGCTKEAISVLDSSISTENDITIRLPNQLAGDNRFFVPVVDEGSTSAKRSGGYIPSLLLAPRKETGNQAVQTQELLETGVENQCHRSVPSLGQSSSTDISVCTISEQITTGATSERRIGNTKRCKFPGCSKGARGASGLCIGHGGGQRCQKPGCTKGAESRTAFCKAHGGGRRCQHLGCTKSAEGKTDYCIAHGGGRQCQYPGGCNKAARGKSGLCIRHGGGKRCKVEGCTRSAEGRAGLCISHGGGRRCQHTGCNKGAQGSTMFCKAHGGGKRCIFAGCTKGAEGSTPLCKGHGGGKRCMFDGGGICPKSVHGGTSFCVAHGGGKRCSVPGCTKSARGRTDCCVRHGGGKRCKFESCGKSAQGSTDFCKAHGGGKRCSWGGGKCEKFARGKNGLCAAHSSMAQQQELKKGSLIAPGLFHGLVAASSTAASSLENSNPSSGVNVLSDSVESLQRPSKRPQLIPPQVLVPLSMKSSPGTGFITSNNRDKEQNGYGFSIGFGNVEGSRSLNFEIPEGRVHGGGLMSLLGGNMSAIDGIQNL